MSRGIFDPNGISYSLNFDVDVPDSAAEASANWRYWIDTWRRRIANGFDLVIVIDAGGTESLTRIGKSTLGLTILRTLDTSLTEKSVAARIGGGGSDLARFVQICRRGQGFLYDEGMWGARSRDAMAPEAKMVGTVLGTLASRGAIVAFCCHSMLPLDTEIRALTAVRLIVRERGLAEVHTRQIQLDLERPRLLPFREDEHSPIRWRPIKGAFWRAYEAAKRQRQDERILRDLEAQRVWEARRLGQPLRPSSPEEGTAGGPPEGGGRGWVCPECDRRFDNAHNLEAHQHTHRDG